MGGGWAWWGWATGITGGVCDVVLWRAMVVCRSPVNGATDGPGGGVGVVWAMCLREPVCVDHMFGRTGVMFHGGVLWLVPAGDGGAPVVEDKA
jgi:hypothetical protein